jgi:hypothetical protein
MQFNGNANSGSIMGYSKKNFGQLRFTGETNFIRVLNNRSLRFATNSTEKMVLDSNGRVGIGYAFPDSWLHVQDNSGAITTAKFDAHEDRNGEMKFFGFGIIMRLAVPFSSIKIKKQLNGISPKL